MGQVGAVEEGSEVLGETEKKDKQVRKDPPASIAASEAEVKQANKKGNGRGRMLRKSD